MIVNIQPDQRAAVTEFFSANGIAQPEIYPMVRGRYVELNGQAVNAGAFDERARRMVEREFNLSYMQELPLHNRIVAGRVFNAEGCVES